MIPLHMLLAALLACLDCEQRNVIAFLREENRVLKAQLGRRRLLREFATLVTPDTILPWHRELVARKWRYTRASGQGSKAR